jgi:hypothetical protein
MCLNFQPLQSHYQHEGRLHMQMHDYGIPITFPASSSLTSTPALPRSPTPKTSSTLEIAVLGPSDYGT